MLRICLAFTCLTMACGCTHRYTLIGESDTDKTIAISIMKTRSGGEPSQVYYTELSGDDTKFIFDEQVADSDGRVEAWFDLKQHPGRPTVYALPRERRVRIQLDDEDGRVVLEDIEFDGKDDPDDKD